MRAFMDLSAGLRLGPYEIVAPLGAGGMGEVYRARDTRLDRSVAIKILPSHLSCDPELKSRFEREARTLSSVSHPHICHLYDVGSQAGTDFLVMELLEGETLATRLQKGMLPPAEVLKIGIEIADALAKAHRLGVIHRDLKPSNIMLTKSGAKLMDFGLAKPTGLKDAGGASFAGIETATVQTPATPISRVGTVVGTIQYMAPEQIEGKEADARSDVFAFGAVLYEMTSGQRAFEGKSHLSVASAILQKEPPPISTIQPSAPPALDYVIRTCLAKDPDERFQTAHDVKLQLSWLLHGTTTAPPPSAAPRLRLGAIGIGLAAAVLILALLLIRAITTRPVGTTPGIIRFSVVLPPQQTLSVDSTQAVALSPDGKRLAYVAAERGVAHLYVRRLDQFDATEIPDSEGPTFPFFSPNGDWVAFFSQGKLKKAPAGGGNPVVICDASTFFGGTWTPQDVIVVALPYFGLGTVPASGGSLQRAPLNFKEPVDPEGPAWLPGGDWIVFTDYLAATRRVLAVKLASGEVRVLVNSAQGATFAAGHLVYYSAGSLWAVPFDAKNPAILGDAVQVASDVDAENYVAQATASASGVLAYAPGPAGSFSRNLFLVNRSGVEQKLDLPPQDYVDPAFSPDGKRVAICVRHLGDQQLAVFDRDRRVLARIVTDGMLHNAPVWTADGKELLYDSAIASSSQKRGIYRVSSDGSSAPRLIWETALNSHVTGVAGDQAVVMVNAPDTSADLWLLSLRPPYDMRPFKQTPAAERQGSPSPDGRWLAYASNESGRSEVYVEPVPGPGGRWQISSNGGEQPRWARSGREIFYRDGPALMSVPVQLQPAFQAAKPVELFERQFDRGGAVSGYDVSPDGQSFVMTRSEHANPTEIRVVIGWAEGK